MMVKIDKSHVFAFLIGAITFGCIGVALAYSIFASDVGFTPRDTTWKDTNGDDIENVASALDDLHKKVNWQPNYNDVIIEKSIGDINSSRVINKTLEKGNYLFYVTYDVGQLQYASGGTNYSTELSNPALFSLVFNSSNTSVTKLGKYLANHVSSGTVNSVHSNLQTEQILYYIQIKDDDDSFTLTGNSKSINYETNNINVIIFKTL